MVGVLLATNSLKLLLKLVILGCHLAGVYMGKLAPARVSYRDDFDFELHLYDD